MVTNWRERVVAALIHFAVTLLIAGIASALIFLVWFPGELAAMVGGAKLFLIVVVSDLVLGPLMSLVIYTSKKSRRVLIVDYAIIATVQMAALIYGVMIVAGSRPVFVAFAVDRLEVLTAFEISDADLAGGVEPQYRSLSWFGPRLVAIQLPLDTKERNDLILSAVTGGKDARFLPKYYRAFDTAREQALAKSQPIETLLASSSDEKSRIEAAIEATGKSENDLRWLLVHHRFGFATAFIDAHSGEPVKYLLLSPAWVNK
jgi:hypothetical protein